MLKCKKAVNYTEFHFLQYTEDSMNRKCNEINFVEACYEKKLNEHEYVRKDKLFDI